MKRFHFPLESLARLRDHKLDLAREALRIAEAKRQTAESELEAARSALEDSLRAHAANRSGARITPGIMGGAFVYLNELRKSVETAQTVLSSAIEEKSAAHREMLKCRRDAKVIERLRENAQAVFAAEVLKEEERESADVYAAGLARRRGSRS